MIIHQIYLLISYVSNVNTFPKPLTEKEEEELIRKYEAGDENAKNELIEHNLRLVAHIAKKYSSNTKDADDLISIGTIGLIKGVSSYNTKKGTKLSTYIARCIENEILMYFRASKKIQNEVSIEEPIGFDCEGNIITFIDILSKDDEDVIEEVNSKIILTKLKEKINSCLTKDERKIIEMRYGMYDGKEYTQNKVAKEMGISRSYVSRIEKRAIEKLRENFTTNE